jgi:phage terminase large subunit
MIRQIPTKGRILNLKATNVYERTIDTFNDNGCKIICHEGGSRSSKTWSIFQYFFVKAVAGEQITTTITRSKLSWIRSTLLKDFEQMVNLYHLRVTPEINPQRQDQVYKINGSEFAFFGLDYPQKLHGRKQDWTWMNEVMESRKIEFDQLEMRNTKGMILDYNPIDDQHWVFDLQKRADVRMLKSTWRDNPFLEQTIIDKILSYEPTPFNIAQGTADNYMWEVYGQGNKARLQGTIFNNWDLVDEIPKEAVFVGYGKDFGYTNDPTTLVELWIFNNELYWNEVLYETGLTNPDIVARYVTLQIKKSDEIFADSSEPKSIEEIRKYGYNIKAVVKGQDSVNFGIDLLKGYKMHVTKRSINIERELRRYKWAEDRTGRIINKPVDAFNHTPDAMRYVATMKLRKKPQLKIFSGADLGL